MYVHQIPHDTELSIAFDDGDSFQGEFIGTIDHIRFNAHCPEILKNIDSYHETEPQFSFFVNDKFFSFTGRILGKSTSLDAPPGTVEVRAITPFKETARRADFRIVVAMRVKIYEYVDDPKQFFIGKTLGEALSSDVSKTGIGMWTDYQIEEPIDTMFTLEFSLKGLGTHRLPAKLIRSGRNMATRSYKYDYGFEFDFSQSPELQNQFLMVVLEYKMRGWK